MAAQVKYVETEVERNEIYRLRHEIYIEEIGDRREHSNGFLKDEIDEYVNSTIKQMWIIELGEFSEEYNKYLKDRKDRLELSTPAKKQKKRCCQTPGFSR